MSIYSPEWLRYYFRAEEDEDLQLKLIFTNSEVERDMLDREIKRREDEANDQRTAG